MAAWPSTLPEFSLLDGHLEAPQGTMLRTEVDAGPPMKRARYTAEVTRFSVPLLLSAAQVATLETFYLTTLGQGVDPFDYEHPRTHAIVEVEFVSRPTYIPAGAGYYRTMLELEMFP